MDEDPYLRRLSTEENKKENFDKQILRIMRNTMKYMQYDATHKIYMDERNLRNGIRFMLEIIVEAPIRELEILLNSDNEDGSTARARLMHTHKINKKLCTS